MHYTQTDIAVLQVRENELRLRAAMSRRTRMISDLETVKKEIELLKTERERLNGIIYNRR